MAKLTFGDIEQLILQRGGTPQQADVGAAIIEAESGGDWGAHGDQSFGQGGGQYVGSLGGWQIFGQAHPEVTASCATDPNCSSDVARYISNNWSNWNAWTTFRTGAYQQYLASPADFVPGGGGGQTQTLGVPLPPGAQKISDALGKAIQETVKRGNPGEALGAFFRVFKPNLTDFAWRTGFIIMGLILIIIGFQILLFTPVTQAVAGVGGTIASRGLVRGALS